MAVWGLSGIAAAPVIPVSVTRTIRERVDYGYCVGTVVGMINPDGRSYFSYGRPALDSIRTVDEQTVFEIGSVTKVFTSLLLADAVQRGEVSMDDAVGSLLPEGWRVPGGSSPITLLHLATQTSGLPPNPDNLCSEDATRPFECYGEDLWAAFLRSYSLSREPGASWEYSNTGMGFLGFALAARAGVNYESLLRERILDPLGMKSTGLMMDSAVLGRRATGHSSVLQRPPFLMPVMEGAGALRSTASDLLDFLAYNLGIRETPLAPVLNDAWQRRTATSTPGISIGLGWWLWDLPGGRIVQHGGDTPGFTAFVAFHPVRRVGAVVLSNSRANRYSGVTDVGLHLLDSAYPLTPTRKPAEVSEAVLAGYMGVYEEAGGDSFEIGRIRQRLVGYHVRSNFEFAMIPESIRRLGVYDIEVGPDVSALFRVNADGAVTGMNWTQGGRTVTYTRKAEPAALRIHSRGDQWVLSMEGGSGAAYELEASSDWRSWSVIGTLASRDDEMTVARDGDGSRSFRAVRRRGTTGGLGMQAGVWFESAATRTIVVQEREAWQGLAWVPGSDSRAQSPGYFP